MVTAGGGGHERQCPENDRGEGARAHHCARILLTKGPSKGPLDPP
jgi:hypothetical protein